ncbi:hypothetical protein [Bacillus sp. NPDC094106]|uniref:hypothetical protein n=1 Tax=Bacillus sp. NPDC094106 TaxID=3363949 RepID=UPI003813BA31
MMKEFLGQVAKHDVGIRVKSSTVEGMRNDAIAFIKNTTQGFCPVPIPNCGDCSLISVELGEKHGFEDGASVTLDVFYEFVPKNHNIYVQSAYRVFTEINGKITSEKYISLGQDNAEEIALHMFVTTVHSMIKKGKEIKEELSKFLLHTVVLKHSTGFSFYEAENLREIAEECDIADILRIYAKGTNISHDELKSVPDDVTGIWFVSHIHDNCEHQGYEFKTAKEVKDILPELLKNAHTCDGDVHEGYVLVYPPHAVLVSL